MFTAYHPNLAVAVVVAAALAAGSCSKQAGPEKPKPGTPGFFWMQAQDAYKKGDYVQAQKLLVDLATGKSEYAAKSLAPALILTHSSTHAYMELAEKFAGGAKRARTNAALFYRMTGEYKTKAKNSGMRFFEVVRVLDPAGTKENLTVVVPIAEGPTADPGQYKKIETGVTLSPAEIAEVETHVLRHEAQRVFLIAFGTPESPEKARAMYTGAEAKVKAEDFRTFLAKALCETAEYFGQKKLSQPNNIRAAVISEAKKALEGAPDTKETKSLKKKIQDLEKELKAT